MNPQSLENFYADKRKSSGLESQCKSCKSEYGKKRYLIPEIKKAKLYKQKEYRSIPEVKERDAKLAKKRNATEETKKHRSQYHKKWYSIPENKETKDKQNREWHNKPENKARVAELARIKMMVPENKIKRKVYWKEWCNNPDNKSKLILCEKTYNTSPHGRAKRNAKNARRKAKKLNATPKWLTKEQKEEIDRIYLEAQMKTLKTGILHAVDHILPLQGKEISGLHVPWNLRVITKKENDSKGNRLIPEFF